MTTQPRTLVWFRGKDLRLDDHAPLRDAISHGEVVPLFVADRSFLAPERASKIAPRIQFLLESLASLAKNIEAKGSRLLVLDGKSVDVIPAAADAIGAQRVVAHEWVEPFARKRDAIVKARLAERGIHFELYGGVTLVPPGSVRTQSGGPYGVFTPFSRSVLARLPARTPLPTPRSLPALPEGVVDALSSAGLTPRPPPTVEELGVSRNPALLAGGERAARGRLRAFLGGAASGYAEERDRMDRDGTSRLSADLKFGTLSVSRVLHEAEQKLPPGHDLERFRAELLWREFALHTLWDRPEVLERPYRVDFDAFPWRAGRGEAWEAFAKGQTGYPIVDAAARQLLGEGFVHNRARMIAASFLTKHLLIDYRAGEAHYLRYLVDGDWAPNNMGWQWSAGCGCDAQPYFRVFNPMTQGKRYDPAGDYVRRYVPELARLPAKHIHAPWEAPESALRAAGVRLDETYPRPIVDHRDARETFLGLAKEHLMRARAGR